jgi:hypothetical protein
MRNLALEEVELVCGGQGILALEEVELVCGGQGILRPFGIRPFQGTFYGPNYIVNIAVGGTAGASPNAFSAVSINSINLGGANGANGANGVNG